ncbi:MAG: hypothetical protein ABSC08_01060 [Bryobacteraceae bacterium]
MHANPPDLHLLAASAFSPRQRPLLAQPATTLGTSSLVLAAASAPFLWLTFLAIQAML